ncbi:hypothetical protein F5Y17DRAFT_429932 [Xylariaceae sp. FL0594]|nr:hypothetical protein F5Y17DRAFT_429932 [Xylariaceae sp. FL0594]
METINNIAISAARAVWGDSPSTAEPVSGRTGDTSKGEPYDAGNMDPPSANAVEDETHDHDYDNENNNYKLSSETSTPGQIPPSSNPPVDGAVDETKDETKEVNTNQTSEDGRDAGDAAGFAKTTGTATESQDTPSNPSTDLKAKEGYANEDNSKGQADTRPPEDPKTNPKSAPTDVDDTAKEDGGLAEGQKLEGPGPKPVAELAKEHGGDAGNASSSSVDKSDQTEEEVHGNKKEVEEDKDDKHDEGTGEKYVKSSGLKADGGDFDATLPGAGKEADRLMEEKGIHNPTDTSSKGTTSDTTETKEKKSLGAKIKEKLHRH